MGEREIELERDRERERIEREKERTRRKIEKESFGLEVERKVEVSRENKVDRWWWARYNTVK